MPLFNRSSFRAGKKPTKRKSASLSNLSSLDDTVYTVQDLQLEGGRVAMKLGGHNMAFEDGQWVIGRSYYTITQTCNNGYFLLISYFLPSSPGVDDSQATAAVQVKKEHRQLSEENNLLKYKVELLLDMLAASNADNYVLQKELAALKKQSKKKQ